MVYGSNDSQHRFPYLKRMDEGRSAIVCRSANRLNGKAHGYVENVACGLLKEPKTVTDSRAKHRIYNIAEPTVLSQADFIRVWLKHLFDAFYNDDERT